MSDCTTSEAKCSDEPEAYNHLVTGSARSRSQLEPPLWFAGPPWRERGAAMHLLNDRVGHAVRIRGPRTEPARQRAEYGGDHGKRGDDGQHDQAQLPRSCKGNGVTDHEGRHVVREVACSPDHRSVKGLGLRTKRLWAQGAILRAHQLFHQLRLARRRYLRSCPVTHAVDVV